MASHVKTRTSAWRAIPSTIALGLMLVAAVGCAERTHRSVTTKAHTTEVDLGLAALRNAAPQVTGNADRAIGMRIAIGAVQCEGMTCFSCYQCHGIHGEGNALASFPRLGGQPFAYLLSSLQRFASGQRKNDTMQEVAKRMSDQQMRDVAAYYASVRLRPEHVLSAKDQSESPSNEGHAIAEMGAQASRTQACDSCHGPQGAGLSPNYPYLKGQIASYLANQLSSFASGEREGSSLHIMPHVAQSLDHEQIEALAHYYASMSPPSIGTDASASASGK